MSRLMLAAAFSFAFLGLAVAQDKKDVPKELAPLQGTWKLTKMVFGGEEEKEAAKDEMSLTFDGDKAIPKKAGQAKEKDLATVKVDATKKPNTIDIQTPRELIRGIYKIEKDVMTLCFYEGKSEEKDRPSKFESPKDSKIILMVLEKAK